MTEKKKTPEGNDMPSAETTRQAKLAAIKQAIADGAYHINNRELADSLLNDLLWEQWERIRFLKP